jgi:hypothetical protein
LGCARRKGGLQGSQAVPSFLRVDGLPVKTARSAAKARPKAGRASPRAT